MKLRSKDSILLFSCKPSHVPVTGPWLWTDGFTWKLCKWTCVNGNECLSLCISAFHLHIFCNLSMLCFSVQHLYISWKIDIRTLYLERKISSSLATAAVKALKMAHTFNTFNMVIILPIIWMLTCIVIVQSRLNTTRIKEGLFNHKLLNQYFL